MPIQVKTAHKKTIFIAVAVLLAAVIIIVSVSLAVNTREIEYYDFQKEVAAGIDVSEHNGEIDWEAVSQSADFAFIRVGYRGYGTGVIKEDICALENLKNARRADIPFGVYFYSQAVNEAEAREEAQFVLKTIGRYKPQLPVIIDFEYPVDQEGGRIGRLFEAGLTAEENTNIINAFCEEVEGRGFAAGVYASSYVLKHNIDASALAEDTAVWVADYNDAVSFDVEYKIWQYSRTGSCDGVSSENVDRNYYYSKIQKGE